MEVSGFLSEIGTDRFQRAEVAPSDCMRYCMVKADTDDDKTIEAVLTALNELSMEFDCQIDAGHIGDEWQLDRPAGVIAADIGI